MNEPTTASPNYRQDLDDCSNVQLNSESTANNHTHYTVNPPPPDGNTLTGQVAEKSSKFNDTEQFWDGAGYEPRRWQQEAMLEVVRSIDAGDRPMVQAVMGAGKSVLIAEIAH